MTSLINTTNIDETYPISGQDNDSQGFRDNFTNIKTQLDTASSEISGLQAIFHPEFGTPADSKGVITDKQGMIRFDDNYKYYCILDYTDGVADIWVRETLALAGWV